jgi:predicted Rossmann-fold nucleotide-binding protein
LAKALVVFPGGFGTMDELFEMLTLIQTEKIKRPLLIIGYDEKYWKSIINFDALVDYGTISRGDIDLFHFCNTPKEAFDTITNYFKTHNFKKKNNK